MLNFEDYITVLFLEKVFGFIMKCFCKLFKLKCWFKICMSFDNVKIRGLFKNQKYLALILVILFKL